MYVLFIVGIKTRRLPIDEYVDWTSGNKTMPLDIIMNIMQTASDTDGDWEEAITKYIPMRMRRQQKSHQERLFDNLFNII